MNNTEVNCRMPIADFRFVSKGRLTVQQSAIANLKSFRAYRQRSANIKIDEPFRRLILRVSPKANPITAENGKLFRNFLARPACPM
ncbi:MAG: hypothetical protein CEE38_14425 [Planctomycetes bacterium B3_Pla]|nr:MAG: hypothetical protein CEE38_14425 [Planctomycetes bacterium B3_Pla]